VKIFRAACLDFWKSGDAAARFLEVITVNATAWSVSLTNDSLPARMRAIAHSKWDRRKVIRSLVLVPTSPTLLGCLLWTLKLA
jgi:hypothetical protein